MFSDRSNLREKLQYKGNEELLEQFKTAFFCSRKCPDTVKSKSRDWAREQSSKGNCIISGFHSQTERDLLTFLMKEEQPVIMLLARSMYQRLPPGHNLKAGLDNGNLLIASPFDAHVKRASTKTARKRNKLMIKMADEIMVAHATRDGDIAKLLRPMKRSRKLLHTLNIPGNRHLIKKGFYAE